MWKGVMLYERAGFRRNRRIIYTNEWERFLMFDLSKVFFGYSDADTEAERNPTEFTKVFFDPYDNLKELISGHKFILYGRKGDGKTAYGAQIKLTANQNGVYAYQRSLNNFNNDTFSQIKTNETISGNPYISFWKAILLIESVGMINRCQPNIQVGGFVDLVDSLVKYGFLCNDNDISVTVTKLVELDSSISINSIVQHGRKYQHEEHLRGAEQIYSAIKRTIQTIYVQEKFVLILDGLDDILNNREFKAEVFTGLIRAVDEINRAFKKTTMSIKCIILIRNDILTLCRDPNLSKFVRDSGIKLSWDVADDPFDSDLLKLVEKRVDAVSGKDSSLREMWQEVFPDTICGKNSIDYVLENVIYRPRDVLQFFIEVQKVFVKEKKLTEDKIQTALSRYSDDYFVESMRDELTGFFSNDVVTALPEVLSKMGTQFFYASDFSDQCSRNPVFNGVSTNQILEKLFQAGYIGQHRPRERTDYTVFSYRNPREIFQEEHECILHRGLMRGLTI